MVDGSSEQQECVSGQGSLSWGSQMNATVGTPTQTQHAGVASAPTSTPTSAPAANAMIQTARATISTVARGAAANKRKHPCVAAIAGMEPPRGAAVVRGFETSMSPF